MAAEPAGRAFAGVAHRVADARGDHDLVARREAEHAAVHLEQQRAVEDQDPLVLVVHEIGPDAAGWIDPEVAAIALLAPLALHLLARNPGRPSAHCFASRDRGGYVRSPVVVGGPAAVPGCGTAAARCERARARITAGRGPGRKAQ